MAKAVAESDAAADQMELQQVMKTSEDDEIQRAIKESKLSAEHVSRYFFSFSFPSPLFFQFVEYHLLHSQY